MTSKKPAKNVLHDLAYFLAFVAVVVALIPLVTLTRKTIWATISPERPTIWFKKSATNQNKTECKAGNTAKDDLFGVNISANKISFPKGQTSEDT